MQRSTLAKRAWLVLLSATCVVYFYGLGVAPLLGPDEPRYAEVAREMFLRGDPLTPTLAGHTWFEKPALLYWLMMLAYGAFGVSEFAARLGSAASGVLTVLLVWWLARKAEAAGGEELRGFGLNTAAVTASSAGLLVFARGASFDILLTMTVAASLACFFVSEVETREGKARAALAGFYAGIGASLLAKGLVGIIIPVGVVALYYLLRRARPNLLRLGILWGPLIALAVAATWYAPVIARHGREFVEQFFVQHHFARYVSNKYKHPQPFYFYLPIAALLALPWTAFLISGLASARRFDWRAEDPSSKIRVLGLAWLIVPVAFFSLSGSKLPGYILPALPGAALLVGERLSKYVRGGEGRYAMRATGVLLLALFVAGLAYAFSGFIPGGESHANPLPTLCTLAIVLPAGLTGALALLLPRRRVLRAASIVGAAFLTVLLIVGCAFERVARRESVAVLMRRAAEQGFGSLPVFQLHTIERTAEFYAAGRLAYDERGEPIKFEGTGQIAEAARRSGGRALVLVPREFAYQLTQQTGLETRDLGDNGAIALVAVSVKE
ncbi:MAG TPA: phospholipid carrier-dependent glycosyltransferase [Pyrinomonadaceae bacterium]|nr:phospholipid carrier-dependent glycosyltransferase [Pyrinomonadaceae bacterium]